MVHDMIAENILVCDVMSRNVPAACDVSSKNILVYAWDVYNISILSTISVLEPGYS